MSILALLVILAAAFALTAFCAGAEAGFLCMPRVKLLSLVRLGYPNARRLANSLTDMSRVVTTLLIGNNIGTVLVSTSSASLAIKIFSDNAAARGFCSLLVAVLMLFYGEYLPKLLFTSRPLRRGMMAAGWYRILEAVLSPVESVFTGVAKRMFQLKSADSQRLTITRMGLKQLISDENDSTCLTPDERQRILKILG